MKRIFVAIGSLALVALLGITMVGRPAVDAQDNGTPAAGSSTTSDTTKESAKDTYLATLAEKLGITTEALQSAIDETNSELGVDGWFGGMGGSHDSHRGGSNGPSNGGGNSGGSNSMPSRSSGILRGIDRAAAAEFLGITEDELNTELDGSTFLAVAEAHGKTADDVRAFLIAQATADIDERLQAAADAAANATATEAPAAESTSISEATEVPTTAPVLTPTATS